MLAVYRGVAYNTEKALTKEVAIVKKETIYRGVKTTVTFKQEMVK